MLVLGGCFVVLAALTDGSYALAAAGLRRSLTRRRAAADGTGRRTSMDRLTGAVYFALGGLTVVA